MKNIIKYDSLFSDELFNEITEHIYLIIKDKSNLFTTSLSWQDSLQGNSGLIARYEFSKNELDIFRKILADKKQHHQRQ